MSGAKSVPYIFNDPDTWHERARGYIPVAPVGTQQIGDVSKRTNCQVNLEACVPRSRHNNAHDDTTPIGHNAHAPLFAGFRQFGTPD